LLTRYRAEAQSSGECEIGKVRERARGGEWENGPGEEWPRRRVGEFLFYISAFCRRKHKCLEYKCLVPSETLCLLPSTLGPIPSSIGLLPSSFYPLPSCFFSPSVKIVDASGYTFC